MIQNEPTPEEKIQIYTQRVNSIPGKKYPIESGIGKELNSMFFELYEINEHSLPPEMRIQRESLLEKISQEKLRGFV